MDTLNEPGETFQPNMHLVAHPVGKLDLAERCFTSMVVGGSVNDRQDPCMTTKTMATVHGKTLDVPFASVQLLT
jgi:hypothetical protein